MPRGSTQFFAATLAALALVPSALAGGDGFGGALGAQVRTAGAACNGTPGLVCSTVTVPLDRTGHVPGTIALHVEVLPPQGTPRGTLFLVAGGPGQGSAHVFALSNPSAAQLYHYLFPGYTLVAYDDRGTGDSGLLDCPPLQRAISADQQQDAAAGMRGDDRDAARLLQHGRARGRHGCRPRLTGCRQDRTLRRFVRDEALARVRAGAPGPRRAPPARFGAAARPA